MLFVMDNAIIPPTALPVGIIPEAVPRSCPMNQREVSFGNPIDIIGPPMPKRATRRKREIKLSANHRSAAEIDIIKRPITRDRYGPIRSIIIPAG